jgi:hydrogenase maturation factor
METPNVKIVTELELVQGIQVLVTQCTKGEVVYGGFVVRNEFKRFIPCGANKSINEVINRALKIWNE